MVNANNCPTYIEGMMLALRQDYESHVNVLCNPISPQNLRNGCVLICNSFSSWCAVSTSSFVRDHIFFVKTLGSTQRLVVWITVTDASFMSWSSDPISVGINIKSTIHSEYDYGGNHRKMRSLPWTFQAYLDGTTDLGHNTAMWGQCEGRKTARTKSQHVDGDRCLSK